MDSKGRGAALVELCVVLALASVVITLLASLTLLVYYRAIADRARYDAIDELETVRVSVSSWLSAQDLYDNTLSVGDGGKKLVITSDKSPKSELSFDKSERRLQGVETQSLAMIEDITFGEITKNGARLLVRCEVTYRRGSEGKQAKQTFVFVTNAMSGGAEK